jgi:tetratricopeptide (TPR) repeat protein
VRCLLTVLLLAGLPMAAGCTGGKGKIQEDKAAFDAGYAAFEAGQWQRAVEEFSRFLRSNPAMEARGEVYYYRGECYVHLKNRREAMDDFERAIGAGARPPIDSFARVAIGNLYYEDGNDAKAAEAYAEALRKPPKELPLEAVALRMGVSLQRLGRWEMADKYFAYLLDRYPDSPGAPEARRRIHATCFAVQIGAYVSMSTAQGEAARARAAGFQPRLVQTARGSQTLNAIQVGRARTYVEATVLARQLGRAGFQTLIVP